MENLELKNPSGAWELQAVFMITKLSGKQMYRAFSWFAYTGLILTFFLVSGCKALSQARSIKIRGLVFQNNTLARVDNVKLEVEKTRNTVSCNYILAGKDFSTAFPLRTYEGNFIRMSWVHQGRPWTTEDFYVQMPKELIPDKPATVLVTIGNQGSVTALFVQ